jgi:hypothetical protein
MPAKRPTSVLVIAIFHFIFGAFGLIGGLVGVGFGAYALSQPQSAPGFKVTSNPPDVMDTMKYMDANVPGWRVYQLTSALLGLALSIALLAAGAGLILMKPWARYLSIAYAIGSILLQGCAMLYMIVYVTPVQVALYDQLPPMAGIPPAQQQSMTTMSKTIAGCTPFGAVLGLIYPAAVLIVMLLPSVAAAFRGESAGPEDEANRYDQTGDRPPPGYGDAPPGYGGEPDDRFGSAPR